MFGGHGQTAMSHSSHIKQSRCQTHREEQNHGERTGNDPSAAGLSIIRTNLWSCNFGGGYVHPQAHVRGSSVVQARRTPRCGKVAIAGRQEEARESLRCISLAGRLYAALTCTSLRMSSRQLDGALTVTRLSGFAFTSASGRAGGESGFWGRGESAAGRRGSQLLEPRIRCQAAGATRDARNRFGPRRFRS